jgi:uncharacterized membrane-anchored protein
MAGRAASLLGFLALMALGLGAWPALAQPDPKQADPKRTEENSQITAALRKGPVDIPLHDEAVLHLPAGNVFLPAKEATILMQRMGNFTGDNFLGLVLPTDQKQNWFVDISYDDSGYVKDDEGKSIDADALLEEIRKGTQQDNDQRRVQGLAELEIAGWIEKPHYDTASHHLVWSLEAREKGGPANKATTVNYKTYALGRRGYITLNLVTSSSAVAADKAYVQGLLSALTFKPGAQYSDFNASTDKIAEYGLLALIGGVAIKKLGLLALGAAFFLKFLKVIIAGALGLSFAVKKFFFGKKAVTAEAAIAPAPDAGSDPAPPQG